MPARSLCRARGSTNPLAFLAPNSWTKDKILHVIDAQQFDKDAMNLVFTEAEKMEVVRPGTPSAKMLDGMIMSTLFYEPSTRTRLSFESAMTRLGGQVLSTESAGEYSSAAKGETLEGLFEQALHAGRGFLGT